MNGTKVAKRGARLSLLFVVCLVSGTASMGQEATKTKSKGPVTAKKDEPKAKTDKERLDLNSATATELQELPGVGEATAKKIVDGRPYRTVDDLAKAGIPERTIEKIKPLVIAHRPASAPAEKKAAAKTDTAIPSPTAPTGPVDLNSARAEDLETLPGVGPAMAQAIIAGRPYKSVDDLERVKGFGTAKVAALKDRVQVVSPPAPARPAAATSVPKGRPTPTATTEAPKGRPTPAAAKSSSAAVPKLAPGEKVNINTASKETLDELPGIGPVKAQAIIDARPFKSIEDVMKVKGIKEGEFGKIKDIITVR